MYLETLMLRNVVVILLPITLMPCDGRAGEVWIPQLWIFSIMHCLEGMDSTQSFLPYLCNTPLCVFIYVETSIIRDAGCSSLLIFRVLSLPWADMEVEVRLVGFSRIICSFVCLGHWLWAICIPIGLCKALRLHRSAALSFQTGLIYCPIYISCY